MLIVSPIRLLWYTEEGNVYQDNIGLFDFNPDSTHDEDYSVRTPDRWPICYEQDDGSDDRRRRLEDLEEDGENDADKDEHEDEDDSDDEENESATQGFFDNYVIPLARKLKECRVFGGSSDECLNYAMQNRNEWEEREAQIIKQMTQDHAPDKVYSNDQPDSISV